MLNTIGQSFFFLHSLRKKLSGFISTRFKWVNGVTWGHESAKLGKQSLWLNLSCYNNDQVSQNWKYLRFLQQKKIFFAI